MGARNDHIESLLAGFDSKTPAEKQAIRAETKAYKAQQHLQEYARLLPLTVQLAGTAKCMIQTAGIKDGNLVLTVEFRKGDRVLPFSNPWVVVNPPILVSDPAGDVELISLDDDGKPTSEVYREAPLAALRSIIARMYEKISS